MEIWAAFFAETIATSAIALYRLISTCTPKGAGRTPPFTRVERHANLAFNLPPFALGQEVTIQVKVRDGANCLPHCGARSCGIAASRDPENDCARAVIIALRRAHRGALDRVLRWCSQAPVPMSSPCPPNGGIRFPGEPNTHRSPVAIFVMYYTDPFTSVRSHWACLCALQYRRGTMVQFAVQAGPSSPTTMRVDALSVIIVLIIGIVGSGICVYALGYMKDFRLTSCMRTRKRAISRPWFFAIVFAFLSAMFNIVLVDNMAWMYWPRKSPRCAPSCSSARKSEAINNAFRQIVMNLLGGVAFQFSLVYLGVFGLPLSFSMFVELGAAFPALVMLPVTLLAFAGITKAAQMPFHTWLLGAMVAPTPTSALLLIDHGQSGRVSAREALADLRGELGALRDGGARRRAHLRPVLVYGHLPEQRQARACVLHDRQPRSHHRMRRCGHSRGCLGGYPAHHLSCGREEPLVPVRWHRRAPYRQPQHRGHGPTLRAHAAPCALHDAWHHVCMFVAPFGMLIAKWATLVSFVETGNVALIILLAFGSAATFMFWAKWLGKLSGIGRAAECRAHCA